MIGIHLVAVQLYLSSSLVIRLSQLRFLLAGAPYSVANEGGVYAARDGKDQKSEKYRYDDVLDDIVALLHGRSISVKQRRFRPAIYRIRSHHL